MSETTQETPTKPAENKPATPPAETKGRDEKPEFDSKKAEKFGYINFDDMEAELRKTIEPRFKRLYADFKTQERATKELRDLNTAMMAKLDRLESTSTNERINSHLATLKAAAKKAAEEGDLVRMTELNDQLVDWKVKLGTSKPAQPVKKEPEKSPEPDPASTGRQLSKSETEVVNTWINEEGDDGRALRPWAQDGHHRQAKAVAEMRAVIADEDFADAPVEDILAEVDRRMTKTTVRRDAAAVLDPDSGPSRGKGRVAPLSDDEKRVAERMYGGKSHEAHEKYRRAKALVKGT